MNKYNNGIKLSRKRNYREHAQGTGLLPSARSKAEAYRQHRHHPDIPTKRLIRSRDDAVNHSLRRGWIVPWRDVATNWGINS